MTRMTSRRLAGSLAVAALVTSIVPPAHAYRRSGTNERVSVASDGSQAENPADGALGSAVASSSISADGRYVAFSSSAPNLVVGDANGLPDIFRRDLKTGRTEIVSVASDETPAAGACLSISNQGSSGPIISANGRWIAFSSCAQNLVPGDLNLDMDAFVRDMKTGTTHLASTKSNGKQGMEPATGQKWNMASSITPDGRYVGFGSRASDLVPNDTNNAPDGFVKDRTTGKLTIVTVDSKERIPSQYHLVRSSGGPMLSDGARYASFASYATDLVENDTNAAIDVFVRDLVRGTTERVSVRSGGGQSHVNGGAGHGPTGGQGISADGRYVVFTSWASNLIPSDSNGGPGLNSAFDVFVHDRKLNRTERVSVDSVATEANDDSSIGGISRDGRYVTLFSTANNLVPGDTGSNGSNTITVGAQQPGDQDVFIYDRKFASIEMISVAPDGTQAKGICSALGLNDADSSQSLAPVVSGGGEHVLFESCARNIVPNDTNNVRDHFVRHRGPHLGAAALSAAEQGAKVVLSGWSGFSGTVVAAAGDGARDVLEEGKDVGAEMIGAELLYRPEHADLLLRLDMTLIPALGAALGGISPAGDPRVLYGFSFSANNGSYEVRAHRVGADPDDPFNPSFGLFVCDELLCTERAKLEGGYGTTGEEIVVSIPLAALKRGAKVFKEGSELGSLRAYTSFGTYLGGPAQVLDQTVLTRKASVRLARRSVSISVGGKKISPSLNGDRFSASFPRRLFDGSTPVTVKTCFGSACNTRGFTVRT